MQGAILLRGLRFHARHGVAGQERLVGNEFTVDLRLETDLGRAARTDQVDDTVDYGAVHRAVAQEMSTPSRLLEHAAARIARRLLRDFPTLAAVEIRLMKRNPPMGADIEAAGVEMRMEG